MLKYANERLVVFKIGIGPTRLTIARASTARWLKSDATNASILNYISKRSVVHSVTIIIIL